MPRQFQRSSYFATMPYRLMDSRHPCPLFYKEQAITALHAAGGVWRAGDAAGGPVRGATAEGVTAFLGLPYAAPPIGPLRYASPRPAPRWTEPRDCSRAGAAAIQTFGGGAAWLYEPITLQGEDCLFLNVWTPDPRGRRPVMVWLHGGAWRAGRGDAAGTVGTRLARAGDVVVVTVNYRLGALGWLAHPALADGDTGAFANWGLQDQVMALHWVQANIAALRRSGQRHAVRAVGRRVLDGVHCRGWPQCRAAAQGDHRERVAARRPGLPGGRHRCRLRGGPGQAA